MIVGYKRSQTSVILRVKITDSTTGNGKTGLTPASTGLVISTIADNEATPTTYTASGSTIETITTLGTYAAPTATKCRFKEVDATNHPGVYELQFADARFAASSAKSLLVSISGVSGTLNCDVCVPLRDLDPYDAVRAGLSALPNVAANAVGGLPVLDANSRVPANTTAIGNNTITAASIAADAITSAKIQDNAFTAAKFAAGAFDAVWTVTARTLSAFGFTVTLDAAQPNYAPAKAGDAMALTPAERTAVNAAVVAGQVGVDAAAIKAKTELLTFNGAYISASLDAIAGSALPGEMGMGQYATAFGAFYSVSDINNVNSIDHVHTDINAILAASQSADTKLSAARLALFDELEGMIVAGAYTGAALVNVPAASLDPATQTQIDEIQDITTKLRDGEISVAPMGVQ
jgi:hypothetical protein